MDDLTRRMLEQQQQEMPEPATEQAPDDAPIGRLNLDKLGPMMLGNVSRMPQRTIPQEEEPAEDYDFMSGLRDFAHVAGTGMSMGGNILAGTIMGGSLMPHGEPREGVPSYASGFSGEPFRRSYADELAFQRGQAQEAAQRLNEVEGTGGMVDELANLIGGVGASTRAGAARILDDAADFLNPITQEGFKAATKRMLTQGSAGATAAGIETALTYGDAQDVLMATTLGGVGGAVAQRFIGDRMLPTRKQNRISTEETRATAANVGATDALAGPEIPGSLSIDNLVAANTSPTAEALDLHTLAVDVPGSQPGAVARNFLNQVKQIELDPKTPLELTDEAAQDLTRLYGQGMRRLDEIVSQVNLVAQDEMTRAFGEPRSLVDVRTATGNANAPWVKHFDSMGRTVAREGDDGPPLGAKPVNGKEIYQDLVGRIAESRGVRTAQEIGVAGPGVNQAFNEFIEGIREDYIQKYTGKAFNRPYQPGDTARAREANKNILPETMPLAQLYNASVDINRRISTMDDEAMKSGWLEVKRHVDDILAEETGNVSAEARKAFARNMELEGAYRLAQDFYKSDTLDLTKQTRDAMNNLDRDNTFWQYANRIREDDPEKYEMFREGFRAAARDELERMNPTAFMNKRFGKMGTDGPVSVFDTNPGSMKIFEEMLGEQGMQQLDEAFRRAPQIDYLVKARNEMRNKLSGVYKPEFEGPRPFRSRDYEGEELEQAGPISARAFMAAKRYFEDDSALRLSSLLGTLNQPNEVSRRSMVNGLEALRIGPQRVGVQAGSMMGGIQPEDDATASDFMDDIRQYLED